VQYLAL